MDETGLNRTPRVRLDVGEESVWMTRFDAAGVPLGSYPVSVNEVAMAFSGGVVSTGLLAADTLFWENTGRRQRIGVWVPAQVREVRMAGRRRDCWRVPMPGMVFVGEGRDYCVWAAKGRPESLGCELFKAPVPNVHDDGKICWGAAKPPRCTPGTMKQAMDLFFESEFNFHLSEGKVSQESDDGGDLIKLLKGMDGAEFFPVDRLVRARRPGTMKELLKG